MLLKSTLETLARSLPDWSKRGLNEAQTSQVIVLRTLQALGYDVWNPFEMVAQVHSGGSSGGYAPDFTIALAGAERFVLEVKALDKTFSVGDREQPVNYANNKGLRWAVLTNGSEWQFFDNRILKPSAEKLALTVELKDPRAADYLGRLLSREVWSMPNVQDALDVEVQAVAQEIRKHLKLGEIEVKLAKELEEGFTFDRRGLAKAIQHTLEPNERELAEEAFDELVKRLLDMDAPSRPTPLQPVIQTSPVEAPDTCAAIVEGMRSTVPNRRASRSAELRAWLGETELPVVNWRDINAGIVEAMIALGQKGFVVRKGYIYKTQTERIKSKGELYPPSAYRQLSDGSFLFLHDGANGHLQKSRRMLEELEVPPRTLRVIYRGETYFLP